MTQFLKALLANPRFTALLITLAVAIGAKLGVDEGTVQVACDVAFVALGIWLGIEVKVAKDKATS